LKSFLLSETVAEEEMSGNDQNTSGARMPENGSGLEGEKKHFKQVKSSSSFVVKVLV
jgi:hypothetical protein